MSEPGSSPSSPGDSLPIDSTMKEISLNDDPTSSRLTSPNGRISAWEDSLEDVDIGVTIPLPVSPVTSPPPIIDENHRPRSRLLTHPQSPSPARQSFLTDDIILPPSPTRRASSNSASLQLVSASRPASPSPSHSSLSSPPPKFIAFKPSLPSATIALNGNTQDVDPSAPFETIQLEDGPSAIPLPTSPKLNTPDGNRRSSWMSPKSIHSDVQPSNSHSSTSSLPRPSSPRAGSHNSTHSHDTTSSAQAGPSTPRLHAPPAHPHPFPLPSASSPSSHNKSPSVTSANSVPPPAQSNGHIAAPVALGVKGSSTLDKVISHTRPSWLPPKDKIEDETHYHQWEDMMAQAREHEKERRKQAEARRLEKEKRLAINTGRWEALLADGFSSEKVKTDESLRKLWFEGIPSHLRGKAWSLAVGNPLAMSKDAYRGYVARARRSIDSGRFPKEILDQLEEDLDSTLPTLRLFVRGSPMRDDLREFVCAWVVYRSDDGLAYAPYITYLAAMFLLNSPPPQAFLSLVNLLARPCLRAFYTQTVDEIDAYYRVFENLQADLFPKIFANCKNLGLKLPESYFRSVFLEQVPFEACCRLWDQIMLDGDGYIFRSALAIFGFLEPRLHYPDKGEIESILEGRNKATQVIVEREKERAKLRGEAYDDTLDGKLSVFGLNENALFDWLADDGWKESRFERLVTRELPD